MQLEFSILNNKLNVNASNILKQLNNKTGQEFKLNSEPDNFYDKYLIIPNRYNKFLANNQNMYLFEIVTPILSGQHSFEQTEKWVKVIRDIDCRSDLNNHF